MAAMGSGGDGDIDWYLEPEAGGAIAKLALVTMRLEQGAEDTIINFP